MNNDELKKKIDFIVTDCFYGEKLVADALIAAGIGDVKEAEHRAEVAERALGNLAYKIAVVKFGDMSTVAMEKVKNAALEQAEKELAEERKDD